jgi:hypothetical protein
MSLYTNNMNITNLFGVLSTTPAYIPFIVNSHPIVARPRTDYDDISGFWTKNQTVDYRMNSQRMRDPIVVVEWDEFKADSRIEALMNR